MSEVKIPPIRPEWVELLQQGFSPVKKKGIFVLLGCFIAVLDQEQHRLMIVAYWDLYPSTLSGIVFGKICEKAGYKLVSSKKSQGLASQAALSDWWKSFPSPPADYELIILLHPGSLQGTWLDAEKDYVENWMPKTLGSPWLNLPSLN